MNLIALAARWRAVHNCHGCELCKDYDENIGLEVEKAELAAKNAVWYNKHVGLLEEIYYRLGEHCAQGRLDSDVWYKITRLRHAG
jgi:hypothetical protein